MNRWTKLSHGQQVAIFLPALCVVGVLALRGLGDSWTRAITEGVVMVLAAVVVGLLVRRRRQGSEKHED